MPEAVLALDTGSPIVSVALAARGELLASRATRLERSSTQLLGLIDAVLRAGDLRLADLSGILALRGPGSFTGLRIGLATALGLHQALAIPATAISTFQALAAAAGGTGGPLLAVVDALRGEWAAQLFPQGDPGRPAGEPRLVRRADLEAQGAAVIGFGIETLAASGIAVLEASLLAAGGLATPAVGWFTGTARAPEEWSSALLSAPIYSRPPAVTTPKRPAAIPAERSAGRP